MDLETNLDELRKLVKDFAPEIADIWEERQDSSEDQGVRTGRLHENHILGIIIKHHVEDERDITTTEIEDEYQIFFKKIARSTVSTYLNQLEKENILLKKREGRLVKYLFQISPPANISPFWMVRNFCILPEYFSRSSILGELYLKKPSENEKYVDERKFILSLSILTILKNRLQKCYLCQFSNKNFYNESSEQFETFIKERIDVLPEELSTFILFELGEIPSFNGMKINPSKKMDLFSLILEYAERFHSDIEFQMNVFKHRQEVILKRMQKDAEEITSTTQSEVK